MIKKEQRLSNFLLVFTWFSLLQTRSNGKLCKNTAKQTSQIKAVGSQGRLFHNRILGLLAGMVTLIEWFRSAL